VVAELITGGALILLLALGGRWLIGRGLAPLSEMAGTAQRITTQGDLTTRMPDADGSTEVGKLGTAINTMLDRIQQAFGARLRSEAKVRQFAADASHELRTPLTTIRGYAELYRQGALDGGQLPDAMRRIEQEARRMGTLVAELLELARLDRTSSLDITETDLAVLVRDAVADARAVEPARPVQAEAPESLVAVVDEARIRQVLANLLGNVREHTKVTTATAVRLAQVRGGVVLEVADGGPGMAADDAARAFDRFYRGAEQNNGGPVAGPAVGYGTDHGPGSARSASPHSGNGDAAESGGSGLGLAIVAAIAQAHGGQATLESAPGRGTRVRIWLPATPPAAPRPIPTPRLSRAGHQHAYHAAPPPGESLAGPVGYPAAPPRQPSSRPADHSAAPPRQPSSRPADHSAAPPRQPSPRPAGYPAAPPQQPSSHPAGDLAAPPQRALPRSVGYPAAPPRQPLPRPVGYPAAPPQRALPRRATDPAPPSRRPLPLPVGYPVPPAQQPPFRQAGYPISMHAAPLGQPAPASRPPPAGLPISAGPPLPQRGGARYPAPPPLAAPPAPRTRTGNSGPGELHHDWLEPPPRPPPAQTSWSPPDDGAADDDGRPARPGGAPQARLPQPGRHRRAGHRP
jgi:signal transduction histidine kinase